jgi:hypothetical protein
MGSDPEGSLITGIDLSRITGKDLLGASRIIEA